MSARTLAVVCLALVFGMLSALAVYQLAVRPPMPTVVEMAEVYMLAANVEPGTILDDTHVVKRQFPKDRLPPFSIANAEDYRDRLVKSSLLKDEPLDSRRLGAAGERSLPTLFLPGERAHTCAVVDSAALGSGFILPQSFVDVLVSLREDNSQGEQAKSVTNVLLQRVQVLAVGSMISQPKDARVDEKDSRFRTVTMRVKLDQAALLQQGAAMGVLHLVLRHKDDTEIVDVPGADAKAVRQQHGGPEIVDFPKQDELERKLAELERRLRKELEPKPELPSPANKKGVEAEGTAVCIIRGGGRSYDTVVHPIEYPKTLSSGETKLQSILAE